MKRVIEYYYALASPWSYLGHERFCEIANDHALQIDPVIIDYDRMFEAAGTVPLPKRPHHCKAYRLVELKRWGEFRQVPINPQRRFYRGEIEEPDEREGALMATAAKRAGMDSLRLAFAIQRALWAQEQFPFTQDEPRAIVEAEGFVSETLLRPASLPETAQAYQRQTERSIERKVFGMPFYIVDDTHFWGQDRLEILEYALQRGS